MVTASVTQSSEAVTFHKRERHCEAVTVHKRVALWVAASTKDAHCCPCLQVLNRLSAALAFVSFAGVLIIFLVLLVGRKAGAGYSLVTAFVIFVSSVPVGIPVVTTTVLAVGARQMAKEKAIVARWVLFVNISWEVSAIFDLYDHGHVQPMLSQ